MTALFWATAAISATAQIRPDAGTLQEPQRQIPALPLPGAPRIAVPDVAPAASAAGQVRLTPAGFSIQGNTVFPAETLLALLEPRLNRPTDLPGLAEAAREIKSYYQDRGYLLTDVYIPPQQFQAQGGTVTLTVVEARVGRVSVQTEGSGVSQRFAERLAASHLQPGDAVSEYALDKPVLLLRDQTGFDASALVEPGSKTGEVNVILLVKPAGRPVEASVGLDNHGARAAGQFRAFAALDAANPSGIGDALSARVQIADETQTRFYKLTYSLPAATTGGRVNLAAIRTEYALGGAFAALGATGRADILSASVLHPLLRSRDRNLFGSISLDHKQLRDELAVQAGPAQRKVESVRAGVLGNFVDDVAGGGAFTSYAASVTRGRLRLDDITLAGDQAVGGANTSGSFTKANLELQRVQFLSGGWSVHASLQAQLASRNLTSAEKISLGGPSGVRGYATGESPGDSGAQGSLELRRQLPAPITLAGEPVSLQAFYDFGTVRLNQDGATGSNRVSLDSAGLGVAAGRPGNFVLNASLSWRIGGPLPTTADPDRSPRLWLSTQKWF
ncbi:MAG: ShlB/FhaC/HecB family hemolysin secretion/activation protein [Burkholderiales bacterium]|nr:ShlB/FhaC/HecB family hemolysin secretion/activation protein [Burkholderiales bacterium]